MNVALVSSESLYTQDELLTICKPLFNLFDITFFRYLKIFKDRTRIHLCTDPLWTQHFYKNSYYNIAWCDSHKANFSKNMEILWDEAAIKHDNSVGIDARAHFNIYHGISMIRPGLNYYEVFDFATYKSNSKINDIYLSNLDLFERFFFYFRDKANFLIKEAEKKRFKPENLIEKKEKEDLIRDKVNCDDFFKKTEMKRYFISDFYGNDIYLTKKEVECLYWCSLGKSAEEIGIIINAAKRTVEIHLENIRQKLKCNKMPQVIKLVVDSGLLEVFKLGLDINFR